MTIYHFSHVPVNGGGLLLNLTATASNSGLTPSGTTGIYLTATIPCFVELGSSTASANTGLYLASSVTYWFPFASSAQVSGVRSGGSDGSLYIKPTCD